MTKQFSLLYSVLLFLFVVLVTMLCWYSRLATDDYWYIWDVRNIGIIENNYVQYMEWCGRYAANFSRALLYKSFEMNERWYIVFPLLSFLFLIIGVCRLFKGLADYFKFSITKSQQWLGAFSFTALLFFLSLEIGEAWFWYDALSDYLHSIIAFVWGISFLLNNKNAFISYLGIIICFVYIGGSSEVYFVIFGLLLLLLLIFQYRKSVDYKTFLADLFNKKLITVCIVLTIASFITIIAPGNYLRAQLFPERKFFYSFFIAAKSIVKFSIIYLPLRLPYIIVFAMPFLLIGKSVKAQFNDFFTIKLKTFFIRFTIIFACISFLFFEIVAYLMMETGPARVWLLFSFLFAIYLAVLSFYLGCSNILKEKKTNRFAKAALSLGFMIMLFHLISQFRIASNYAKAHDERIAYVTKLNNELEKDTVIKLTPLPPCGMLYADEISGDTSHFTNKELRLGYNLKYHVIK